MAVAGDWDTCARTDATMGRACEARGRSLPSVSVPRMALPLSIHAVVIRSSAPSRSNQESVTPRDGYGLAYSAERMRYRKAVAALLYRLRAVMRGMRSASSVGVAWSGLASTGQVWRRKWQRHTGQRACWRRMAAGHNQRGDKWQGCSGCGDLRLPWREAKERPISCADQDEVLTDPSGEG
eukprot:6896586-Prymnesium_polylepis.2